MNVSRAPGLVHGFLFPFDPGKSEKRKVNIMKKKILALTLALALALGLAACSGGGSNDDNSTDSPAPSETGSSASFPGIEDGVLTLAMECASAPYNWAQSDDSNGAVPIKDSNEYANGYDVMMAKKICEKLGVELEIVRLDWDSLIPAVQTGQVDATIAGQSMTAGRMEMVDFAGPYYYATIVCMTKQDSALASATGISQLSGKTTAQIGTIWYDTCLPQIPGADIQTAAESAPAMLMALETGAVEFICTDMPTAQGAMLVYPDLKILDFTGSDDDFALEPGDVNVGIAVMKGNTTLTEQLNSALADYTADDFPQIMNEAITISPVE